MGLLGVPVVLGLRDLGPTPGQVAEAQDYPGAGLYHTVWTEGMHIVRDAIGTRIKASDLEVGDLVNAAPAILYEPDPETGELELEGVEVQITKSKSALILLRMEPEDIKPGKGRDNWTVDGIVAYSKICTHVGCPISLNERTTHHLLCPCHQSTFDLADSGKVVFGPAARSLPQLPIMVDSEGYLVAQRTSTSRSDRASGSGTKDEQPKHRHQQGREHQRDHRRHARPSPAGPAPSPTGPTSGWGSAPP